MDKLDAPLYVQLGKQLKQARTAKGYSLQYVADKVGKSKVSIKRYEDAKVRIDMDTLKQIADLLGMQVMDSKAFYNDKEIEHNINLYPKFEEMILYDEELQKAGQYWENVMAKLSENFVHSDVNIQKSVLMMLNFSDTDIDEVMKFLHM